MKIQPGAAVVVSWLPGGCSLTHQAAEVGESYLSREHFTLINAVPANFGITSKALYSSKSGHNCEVYSLGLENNVIRQQRKSNTAKVKSAPQTTHTEILLASQMYNPSKQC
ncbi:hypothetical protein [Pseudomonas sp. EA_5y_Pfl2_R50]|uniref:hypothetical protein n=1 Tax=Pseudomonas sp. EA_5y_Pfl2_R50 TaxID=3088691 RepID=UPI0030D95713